MHQRTDRAVREKPFVAPLLDAVPRQPGGPGSPAAPGPAAPPPAPVRGARRWPRLLPTPTGTPFTFGYLLVLVATSLFMEFADPATVAAVLRESSTDVVHLGQRPLLVLTASALWVVGGLGSPMVFVLALVLTALERRIGGWRTAGVFVLGHVVATLATEIPVGISVVAGHLPESSLHRLDYGISFGLMASVGALTGLFTPLVRTLVLGGLGVMLASDLVELSNPLTDWGHPLALLLGIACWPLLRRAGAVREAVTRGAAARGDVIRGAVISGAAPSRRAPRRTRPPARVRGPR
ncbi:rhomboid-like protein [Streptomyces sp. NPDC007164]|uniref:rhomboid-like protein n=1 Tax=Streptomyces sp. NPDC007164 TaxID=3156918 RepID=UPI0034028A73